MLTTDTAAAPLKDPLRKEWVKFQLRARGSSLSQIARELDIERCALAHALRRPYPRLEREIAKRLGLKPEQVWPERYDEHGKPNRKRGRPKSITNGTTGRARRNVHAQRAA